MAVLMVPGSYSNIQSAVNAAVSGDEIHVENGVYNEKITVNSKENISIKADGDNVILDGSGLTNHTIGFNVIRTSNLEISGFLIRKYDNGIIVSKLSKNITVSNNTINDIRDDGIKIKGDYCNVTANSISKCKDDAIKVTGNNCSILNNNISDNGEEGIEINGEGNSVRQNAIKDNLGIGVEVTGKNNAITENSVKNSTKSDFVNSGTNNTIINNN